MSAEPASSRPTSFAAAMPALFVVLWSSGFIGAKYGTPYAEPFTFLLLRFALAIVLLGAMALVTRAAWPGWRQSGHLAVAGLLVQGVYLAGVYAGLRLGVPAGVSALIVCVQPVLTAALVGPFLGERVRPGQWLGFALGFAGVALVVSRTLDFGSAGLEGLAFNIAALLGITGGTLYQKKFCARFDLRTGSLIQYLAAALLIAILCLLFERWQVEWTPTFVFSLLWLVLVLSIGAMFLLFILIRRGAASRVASLFYLVPPVTALMAYGFLGERLGPLALLGMAIAALGVALVNR